MARKTNPKSDLEKLKSQQRDLAAAVKKAETRLHISLGKLVCGTGADAIPEDQLRSILEIVAARGGQEMLRQLRTNAAKSPTREKPPAEPAAGSSTVPAQTTAPPP